MSFTQQTQKTSPVNSYDLRTVENIKTMIAGGSQYPVTYGSKF